MLIDEQRNDKNYTLAELMGTKHDAIFTLDQFGTKGVLPGIAGDKGDGKTVFIYGSAISV